MCLNRSCPQRLKNDNYLEPLNVELNIWTDLLFKESDFIKSITFRFNWTSEMINNLHCKLFIDKSMIVSYVKGTNQKFNTKKWQLWLKVGLNKSDIKPKNEATFGGLEVKERKINWISLFWGRASLMYRDRYKDYRDIKNWCKYAAELQRRFFTFLK